MADPRFDATAVPPRHLGPWLLSISRRRLSGLLAALAGVPAVPRSAHAARRVRAQPEDVHPRLFLTPEDLPRLRDWANDANPMWRDGLLVLAEEWTADMDAGAVPGEDGGSHAWEQYPTEMYAEFFAFLSLIHPDEATRTDYAERARTLLMYVITEAAQGPAADQLFRDPYFALSDRSRWWGEAFALTVDWIYPVLSAEEKETISQVFRRWIDENVNASTTSYNHPEPIGVVNDPILLADPIAVRWAANNYFTAHMRNIGLMALALDPADDVTGELASFVENATGAWLYMADSVLRGDARGGLAPEGFEYSQQAIAYVAQFLLALHTAGLDNPDILGPQVVLANNPFWDELIPGYLHSLSPQPTLVPDYEYLGPVYQPAWYGDGQTYWGPDFIGVFGALGRYDDLTGNTARLDALRWIQTHLPPGGAEALIPERVANNEVALNAILYFMLLDRLPLGTASEAPEPADPRSDLPLVHFSPGLNHLLVRTSWEPDATWFTYSLSWNTVDHQHCDGNQFELYRNGEWLTKERTGYGFNIGSSDYHNTLALENDPPAHNEPDDYRTILWQRGSQWMLSPSGDPTLVALSVGDGYVYALGDATNLYNSTYEESVDILHASRSLIWLQPDTIVVYDRAATRTDGRFKRFWLNLPTEATIDGNVATMTTASGQRLEITTLLPLDAAISSEPAEPLEEDGEPAVGDPMQFRLRVEAPGGPQETRFFHVLQAADADAQTVPMTAFESADGTFAGVVVGTTAVLVPVVVDTEVVELRYTVPAETATHVITGLTPEAGYDLLRSGGADGIAVMLVPGAAYHADAGGVLAVTPTPLA